MSSLSYIIIGCIVGACIALIPLLQKRKQKQIAFLDRESRLDLLAHLLASVEMSVRKVNTSKNAETRKGNLESAISIMEQALREVPEATHLVGELEKMKGFRVTLHTEIAQEAIEKFMDKARTAKTVSSQVTQGSNALAYIEGALREEFTDNDVLQKYQTSINEFISQAQLSDMEAKAEKLAMKGQYAKAADVCLDAIFHLKNDNIDDVEQAAQFQALEERLTQFKVQAEEAQKNKKAKR